MATYIKKLVSAFALALSVSGCGILGNINWDPVRLGQAASAALTAVSITDEQVIALSRRTVAQLDAENRPAGADYQKRLANILSGIKSVEGLPINYKVYNSKEINAFACGDGSIRVYSALMDMMDDDEIMAIIGHECGHVVHQDTKHAMRNAYLAAAARGVISATGGTVATLSKSVLGDLGEVYLSSRYSQKQEFSADEYGFEFSVQHGCSPYSMCDALEKLVKLSEGTQAHAVQKMFSSHPDSALRAQKMRARADAYSGK